MTVVPPLAVDIDGTLTRPDKTIDPRIFDPLRLWADKAPVVIATGKSFPFPVGLCEFIGIPRNVIAENGGVVYIESCDQLEYLGDSDRATSLLKALEENDYDLGWGSVDLVNRWRETEIAVARDRELDTLESIAKSVGMDVVDSGYAYHAKQQGITKATGLHRAASLLEQKPDDFVMIGDSENDIEVFKIVGTAIAVNNANQKTQATADHVTTATFADGFLEALEFLESIH